MTPLSENVSEAPAASEIGESVNRVVALAGETVTLCPAPLSVSDAKTPGSLTVIFTALTVSAAPVVLLTVSVPAATEEPGNPELVTDEVVTFAPVAGVAVGPGVGVGEVTGVAVVVATALSW